MIPVLDHGFLYGEGVYETTRTRGGRVSLYTRHLRRMRRSARMMALDLPFSDDGLAAQIEETIAAARRIGPRTFACW